MEPAEVVDSLRGLVAVADNAFRSTYDFAKDKIDPFMDIKRRDEIRRVATEIQDLAGLLHRLTLVASTFDEDYNQVLDDVYGLRSPKLPQQLFTCRQTLIKLEASLSRRKLTYDVVKQEEDLKSRAKLRWPFTTAWTVDLVQEIGQHKEAVTRALPSNSMNELLQSFSKGKDRHSPNRREVIRRFVMGRCRYSKENSTVTSFFARVDHLEVLTRTVSKRTNWTEYEMLEHEPIRRWIDHGNYNDKSSHLWITGGPGAGKTTFAATLIETAMHIHYSDQATAVIFAFCRFSDPRSYECFFSLSTLLAQIAVQHPSAMTTLGKYYSELRTRRLVEIPTIERMKAVFFAMTKVFRQILCVVDGVDECPDEGDAVTQLMASLASGSGNFRLAMVSRYRQRIETTLKGSFGEALCCKEFEPDRNQLEMFAATEIEKMAMGANSVFHNLQLKDNVIQSFGRVNNPSFRFASCSIEYIARYATTQNLHEMSETLPQNLEGIYKLTLQRFNEQPASTKALIQSALQLTAFSDPPLTSHELCQALSVAGIPGLDADELQYPEVDENEITDSCGIFLTKATHGEELGLAHHTIKEFLEQIDPTDSEFAGYHLSKSRTRRLLGICALRFLCLNHFARLPKRLNSENSFMCNRRRRLPFYRYAALVWPRLADELWDDEEFRQQAMELCNPAQTSNFKAWSLEVCHFYRLGGSWNGWVNDRFEDKPWSVGTHYGRNRWYSSSDSLCSESTEACTGPSGSHWGTSKSPASSESPGSELSRPEGPTIPEELSSSEESSGSEEIFEAGRLRSWLWRQKEHTDWKWQEGQTRRLAHFIRRGDFTPLHMACLLGLNRLCDSLLADQPDVNQMSRIGSPLQCALGGPFLIACHDLSTRKTNRTWNRICAAEKPSIELLQTLIEAGADCTRPLPAQYSWNSMGALGLKSSEWAGDCRIFAEIVKGGAQMHDDAICTFRLRCREWTKYKKQQARLDVAAILEILEDMVLRGEAEASAYLTAFRSVFIDMHDIDVPLPALEAVTDDMLVNRMKKAIESDSLSTLKETGQTIRGQLVLQGDMLDGLLDHAVTNLAASCLSFLLDRLSGSENENVKLGRLLLRCTGNQFEDVLVSLLKHGSKATTTDQKGRNIWHLSTVGRMSGRILQVLMSTHVGKEDREIALHALDNIDGRTPLASALFMGHPDYHGANIILKHCRSSKDMLQSARPSVNAIIAGIDSPQTLQQLHNRGVLPVPEDETPLHLLQQNVRIDVVKQLLAIYSYQDSLKWKSPVSCYLASSSYSTYKEDVLRLLISTELLLSLGSHQRSIWSMVIDHLLEVLSQPPPSGVQWASDLVDILVDTGCLANHETVSGISALRELQTLVGSHLPESPKIKTKLVMILENIFSSVIDATTDYSDLKGTSLGLQLLHWAVVHDSVYLVDRLLSLGVDVHARSGSRGESPNALELISAQGNNQSSVRILTKILQKSDKARINSLHRCERGDELAGLLHLHGCAKPRLSSPRTPLFEFCLPTKWGRVQPKHLGGTVNLLETGGFARFRRPSLARVTLLRSLLDEGCNPNTLSQPSNRSPLLIHIMAGNLDGARILLRRGGAPSLSISDAFGWTPAAWACAYGWTFLLEEMITVAGDQRLWDFEVTMCLKEFRIMGVNYKQVKALHIATIGSAETVAYLLDQGYATDLDITTSNGTTALHIAAILGQHDSISLLISRGANIDAQDQGGFTPLHASIYHSNDSTTALLLKMGAKHLKSKNGKTPLDIAIHRNTKAIMQMVQDSVLAAAATGKDVASQEKQMKATVFAGSMQYAIDRDDEEDVVKLLDAECSPNIIMSSCRTCSPLLYALGKNDVPEGCVSVLISRGASFKGMTCRRHGNSKRYNAVTWQGWQRGSKIEDGSGSSSSDSLSSPSEGSSSDDQAWPIRGSTTLDFFMDGGRPEKTLLTYLEAIPLTELVWLVNNSATAHRAIKRKSNDSLAALLSHLKRVESSLGRNLAKEVATQPEGESGNTPLHLAAIKKNVVAAKLLIAHGADPDAANSSGMTPLHLAADREGAAMVEALLNQGASIEVRYGRGRTALQAAVLKDNIHAIEALLARGTRIEVNDGGNRFIYLDKIKPFRMLLAAGMSINQPGALGLPVWSSALLKVEVATFLLNSDFARDIAVDPQTMVLWPSWWQAQVFEKESSRRCLPLFYRRLGPTFLRRLGQFEDTTSESRNFSLLCFAAQHGRVDEVRNLLKMGLDVECEGSAAGTALMAAAHEGRADVVKILVFHSARIHYKRAEFWVSALDSAKCFPKIVEWLLVGRFIEQGKLQMPAETSSDFTAGTRPWSGVRQGVFLLEGKFQRNRNQSSIKWLQSLQRVKRMMRGTVAVSELWIPALG